jgi:hypothetical protein
LQTGLANSDIARGDIGAKPLGQRQSIASGVGLANAFEIFVHEINYVAHRSDQLVAPIIEAFARMVRVGGGFFQNGGIQDEISTVRIFLLPISLRFAKRSFAHPW